MANYTTADRVRDEMAQLPARVTDEYIEKFIIKAESYVNAMLSVRYKVPIILPIIIPELLRAITLDLAVFFLYEALYSSNAPNLDEYQEKRYDRAMELLEKIVAREIDLPGLGVVDVDELRARYDSTTLGMQNIFSYEDPEW